MVKHACHLITLPNGIDVYHLTTENTEFIYREVFVEDCYSQNGIEVRNGDIVFDIGANIGFYSLQLARTTPEARVFAFEPIPAIFDALNRNMELHECTNVKPIQAGVSSATGQATFTYYPRTSTSSTMYPEIWAQSKDESCRYILADIERRKFLGAVVSKLPQGLQMWIAERIRRIYQQGVEVNCRLDTVSNVMRSEMLDRIDLLKVDAEYAEMDILAGIEPEHWPSIRQVIVEVHDSLSDLSRVIALLETHGFRTVVERSNSDLESLSLVFAKRSE